MVVPYVDHHFRTTKQGRALTLRVVPEQPNTSPFRPQNEPTWSVYHFLDDPQGGQTNLYVWATLERRY